MKKFYFLEKKNRPGVGSDLKKLASCDPCGGKIGLKTVAFILRLSIC